MYLVREVQWPSMGWEHHSPFRSSSSIESPVMWSETVSTPTTPQPHGSAVWKTRIFLENRTFFFIRETDRIKEKKSLRHLVCTVWTCHLSYFEMMFQGKPLSTIFIRFSCVLKYSCNILSLGSEIIFALCMRVKQKLIKPLIKKSYQIPSPRCKNTFFMWHVLKIKGAVHT